MLSGCMVVCLMASVSFFSGLMRCREVYAVKKRHRRTYGLASGYMWLDWLSVPQKRVEVDDVNQLPESIQSPWQLLISVLGLC